MSNPTSESAPDTDSPADADFDPELEYIDLREVERLRLILTQPWRFQERRVERVSFETDGYFRADIRQQIWDPTPADRHSPSMLVSLGLYSKSRRPTLEARSDQGQELPILSRSEQARVLSWLLFDVMVAVIADEHPEIDDVPFEELWDESAFYLDRMATAPRQLAIEARESYRSLLQEIETTNPAAAALLESSTAWSQLEELVETTQVLVRIADVAVPHFVLRHNYAQELMYDNVIPDPSWSVREATADLVGGYDRHHPHDYCPNGWRTLGILARNIAASIVCRALTRLGMLPTVLGRRVQNADHSDSFYLFVDVPRGVICTRSYWDELNPVSSVGRATMSSERWHTNTVCFAAHISQCEARGGQHRCYIELRPDRGPSAFITLGLAILSAAASTALAMLWIPVAKFPTVVPLLAAVPGALTAAVTQNSSKAAPRVTNGLLLVGYLTGALSLAMGFAALLRDEYPKVASGTATFSAMASAGLALLLVWICGLSRFFDGPNSPAAVLADAKPTIKMEKVVATFYAATSLVAIALLGLALRV